MVVAGTTSEQFTVTSVPATDAESVILYNSTFKVPVVPSLLWILMATPSTEVFAAGIKVVYVVA